MMSEDGTTAIEYALIGSLVSVGIIVSLRTLGSSLEFFNTIWSTIAAAAM